MNHLLRNVCVVVAIVAGLAPAAHAQWAPVTNPTAQLTWWNQGSYPNATTVYQMYYSVLDPIRNAAGWQDYQWVVPQTVTLNTTYWKPGAPTVSGGVVFWPLSYEYRLNTYSSGLGVSVYDPSVGAWQPFFWQDSADAAGGISTNIQNPQSLAGVTAWCTHSLGYATNNYTDTVGVFATTYDASVGKYEDSTLLYSGSDKGSPNYWRISDFSTSDGVVTWVATHYVNSSPTAINFAAQIYDTQTLSWVIGSVSLPSNDEYYLPTISNGTVTLVAAGKTITLGYHQPSHQWVSTGPTLPSALFFAKPATGHPLAYTFFNHAIAGDSFSWNFGDGTTDTTHRSPIHTYAAGIYTATLTVTAQGQTSTTSQKVYANISAPAISITSPANGSKAKAGFTITGTATANGVNNSIASVGVTLKRASDGHYWSGSAWLTSVTTIAAKVSSNLWTVSSAPGASQMSSGQYSLTALATDAATKTTSVTSSFSY